MSYGYLAENGMQLASGKARSFIDDFGYLYLRGALDRSIVRRLATKINQTMASAGWLADPESARPLPNLFYYENDPEYLSVTKQLYRLEEFHQLPHTEEFQTIIRALVGDPSIVHPNLVPRISFPLPSGREYTTTPRHQDCTAVQGTDETFTAWVPLINCSINNGPLAVAAESHKSGIYPRGVAADTGNIEVMEQFEGCWLTSEFSPGDVLLFHSHTVHKALPNRSPLIRVSIDFRFQNANEVISEPSVSETAVVVGEPWNLVYESFRDRNLPYYWRSQCLRLRPYDKTLGSQLTEYAFQLGEEGHPAARYMLERVIVRTSDEQARARAANLLSRLRPAPAQTSVSGL